MDKHTKRKIDIHYIQGKKTAEENTEHLSKVLDKITFDARTHGVGSRGGHIARELKSPGPINGHSVVSDFDKFISPANFFPKHLPKMSFKPKKLDRPDWDEYFAAGNALALRKIVDDVPGKPSRTSNFRQEILKYRVGSAKKRLLSNSEPVIPTHQDLQQEKVEKPMNDLDMLLAEMDDIDNKQTDKKKKGKTEITSVAIGELGIDQPSEAPPVQKIAVRPRQPPELVNLAHQLWQTLIEELRASALAIDYKDILEISVFREPPEFIVVLVGYWCLLLGLKPTWHAAKSSLFLELMPLQNFLREVYYD